MSRTVLTLVLLSLTAAAQLPGPNALLKRLDPFLGTWTGEGEVFEAQDGIPMAYKSRVTTKRILGGHFVQEDYDVRLAGVPVPLVRRTLYWYDAQAGGLFGLTVSNAGRATTGPVTVTAAGTLVVPTAFAEPKGSVFQERVVQKLSDTTRTFHLLRSIDGGAEFAHVRGTFARGGDAVNIDGAQAPLGPVPSEMAALAGFLGSWTAEGTIAPMPGMPPVELTGKQTVTQGFGGHVNVGSMTTAPLPGIGNIETRTYVTYDVTRGYYRSLALDSFGGAVLEDAVRQADGTLILMGRSLRVPVTTRSLLRLDKEKNSMTLVIDQLHGNLEARRSLDVTFTRQK